MAAVVGSAGSDRDGRGFDRRSSPAFWRIDDGAQWGGGEAVCTLGGVEAARDFPTGFGHPEHPLGLVVGEGDTAWIIEKAQGLCPRLSDAGHAVVTRGPPEYSAPAGRERWPGVVAGDGVIRDAVPGSGGPQQYPMLPASRRRGTRHPSRGDPCRRPAEALWPREGASRLVRGCRGPVPGPATRSRRAGTGKESANREAPGGPVIVFSHHRTGNAACNA